MEGANSTQIDCVLLRKVVRMFRIKFPTKRIFRMFPILRTVGVAPFWNLFMELPS